MVAMLYANNIIAGKKSFTAVPEKLRGAVAEILTERGKSELITE